MPSTVVGVSRDADHGPRPFRRVLDVAFVLVLLAASVGRSHVNGPASMAFAAALVLPLLARKRAPVPVFGLIAALALAQWIADVRSFGAVALLVALYAVAASQPLRTTIAAAVVVEVGVAMAVLRWSGGLEPTLRAFVAL